MPEFEDLFTVKKVTDDDTGNYEIGEIEGFLPDGKLEEYLKSFGEKGKTNLLEHFAFLQYQVWNKWLEMQREDSKNDSKAEDEAVISSVPLFPHLSEKGIDLLKDFPSV